MNAELRVSVRELVGFTYFPPDILPGRDTEELLAGTLAHQGRQRAQADQFDIEKTVRRTFDRDGASITVFGRMDAFRAGDPPIVEEIKHCAFLPEEALPEHRAQAMLYAAMMARELGAERVCVRVAYVDEAGGLLRSFEETPDADALERTFEELLAPWLRFALSELAHEQERNASLRALAFPFETYRAGQRELAVQVYTAIGRKKRLFASLPTGTGKSAAVLFPALKAMGEGKTRRLIYLTARTTARQSPLETLERMHAQGMKARVTTLLAKEKLCPAPLRCHPDDCPRAKGHFLREPEAVEELLRTDAPWTEERITEAAARHTLCPFELALSLVNYADVALMDLNYAFDPFAQLERVFRRRKDFTLLIDEAHHTLDRVRESLSGTLDGKLLTRWRASFGKAAGRRHPYYQALTALLHALRALAVPEDGRLAEPPEAVTEAAQSVLNEVVRLFREPLRDGEIMKEVSALARVCTPFLYAAQRFDERYAALAEAHGRERTLQLYCLSPAEHIAAITKGLRGAVFFSATLSPLAAMRDLLGGSEEDACFALPSPFPPERLAVLRRRVNTRYAGREESAEAVAKIIAEAAGSRRGKYIAFFPSYAYLRLIAQRLEEMNTPPLLVQENDMSEDAKLRFLEAFTRDESPRLGLCVLGGMFSEGVDLPGDQLIGAIVVGVGLPTPSQRLRALQAYYQQRFGDGFLYAWQIPAMQKVAQAGGRVIRTETDRGMIVLVDDRYFEARYQQLLPPEWQMSGESVAEAAKRLENL